MGESGTVTGIDMTDAQLDVANRHKEAYCAETLGYAKPNMKFVKAGAGAGGGGGGGARSSPRLGKAPPPPPPPPPPPGTRWFFFIIFF